MRSGRSRPHTCAPGLSVGRPAHRGGRVLHPDATPDPPFDNQFMSASLDHAIYFHRPVADQWHLQTFTCHGLMSSRGVSVGYVFTTDGTHVATVVQEVLLRKMRRITSSPRP